MRTRNTALGLPLAVLAAFAFGVGGPFVRPLLESGWSSTAAVLCRCLGTVLALLVPALVLLRGRWSVLRRNAWTIVAYGAFAVAVVQLFFYSAITRMSVGGALLIEYLAPVLLVLWSWLRTRRRPGGRVLAGCALAVAGLLLVVDLTGSGGADPVGPVLALIAAIGVAVYYVVNARVDPDLHPIVLLTAAMLVGSVLLLAVAAVGIVPLRFAFGEVLLAGTAVPWWVSAGVMVLVSTTAAYLLGIAGGARLGSRVASFVGLFEVLFAVLAAWVLLGDLPAPIQLVGGVLILAGVVLVKLQGERPEAAIAAATAHVPPRASRWPFRARAARTAETSRSGS
ncbi:EamA family transporter [Amnibacterium kyonggiense]|uniref:Threonine/homoserine efflux transporter RhtA n=1 Tax=Amnibacterium kyonggiense TaxID=595671 RepID=A0A4V6Q0Y8_9MICO|nr:EamA family transporter [Amnibacterium kyonggiense]TDS76804.1 threonine/homoserine efflux transporter RhtA [Amnibacterium kyonggiense]